MLNDMISCVCEQMVENLVTVKKAEVNQLEAQVCTDNILEMEKITVKKVQVEERFNMMAEPLTHRSNALHAQRKALELLRDIDDEKVGWIINLLVTCLLS